VGLPTLLLAVSVLATPLPASALCLRLEGEPGQVGWRAVAAGDEVHLRFRHSLWGSLVEEEFRVAADGFELVRLRYAEARLAEFYGHEAARREGGGWVVEPAPRLVPSLVLRVSRESGMQLVVGVRPVPLASLVESGGVIRLTVNGCGIDPPTPVERDRHARGDD